jgi:uncharacterized membrane protein
MKITPRLVLHDCFRTGITIKGIDGVLELIGGAFLWFLKPSALGEPLRILLEHELSRDPRDFLASHLLHATQNFSQQNRLFAVLFLLSHGLVKIAIVAALWADQLWAYPLGIFVFSAFGVYQAYRWTHTHSFFLVVITIFDAVVVYLTWAEYRAQKRAREPLSAGARRGSSQA